MLDISACFGRTRFTEKDNAKAKRASKYIGRGSERSSTRAYGQAIGPARCNCGNYGPNDIVWISAEGNRRGRIAPDFSEIGKACAASATIITDTSEHRARPYNLGEREVAQFLGRQGYVEIEAGCWTPANAVKQDSVTREGNEA